MGDNRLPSAGVTGTEPWRMRPGKHTPQSARMTFLLLMILLCVAIDAESAVAAPKPALVPRTWQLDMTFEPPRPIAVQDKKGVMRWYWFITYKVVNRTRSGRIFLPTVTVATDRGDIVRTNPNIPMNVFDAIKMRTNIALLEHPVKVDGAIKPGEDRARQSVAMWPAFDHEVDTLSVFFEGLSGETAKVMNPRTGKPIMDPDSLKPQIDPRTGKPFMDPDTGKPKVNPRPLLLRKTLELQYHMPGSGLHPQNQPMIQRKKRWVMR